MTTTDPQNPETAFELPPVQPQSEAQQPSLVQSPPEKNPEVDPSLQQNQSQATNNTPQQTAPDAQQTTQVPQAVQATTNDDNSTSPQIADDVDLIEKEWVEKAKEIVNKTKEDPYSQNKEVNKFKATYIKKRYNKDMPLNKE